jgi:hypothetical protein
MGGFDEVEISNTRLIGRCKEMFLRNDRKIVEPAADVNEIEQVKLYNNSRVNESV